MSAIDNLTALAVWPASLAHEATHVAAGWRWTDRVEDYDLHPLRGAWVALDLDNEMPPWAVTVTAVAPTLVGTAFAAAALAILLVGGGSFPDPLASPGRWLLIAAWWLVYTTPSSADLAKMQGGWP